MVRKPADEKNRFAVINREFPSLVKHSTWSDYRAVLDERIFRTLFKFAVVRDPWERALSFYFSPHRGAPEWSREGFKKSLINLRPAVDYLMSNSALTSVGEHVREKSPLTKMDIRRNIDFVIRFENLQADFDRVCEILRIPRSDLPHLNRSNRDDLSSYYDDGLVECVGKRFADDVKCFGYRFPAP